MTITRRSLIRTAAFGASALALPPVLTACQDDDGPGAAGPTPGGTIKIAIGSFGNAALDPAAATRRDVSQYLLLMYDSLLEIGADGSVAPGLAEEWSLADDDVTWTFNLREGVQFHDGWGEVTAADVKFSIERWMHPDSVATEAPQLRNGIERIETDGDYTLRIVTKGPQPHLLYLLAPHEANGGIVTSRKYLLEEAGEDFAKQTEVSNAKPIGSGPFRFVSVDSQTLVYESVGEHWRVTPTVGRVEFLLVPEPATQVAMLKTGEADIISIIGDQIADIEGTEGLAVRSVPDAQALAVMITGTFRPPAANKPTAKPEVRRALALAIDKETILETLLHGDGTLPTTPFATLESTADIDVDHFEAWAEEARRYDPDEAKQIIADAGYPNGFQMKMFSFQRPEVAFLPQLAELIVSQWKEIGVEAELVAIDYANFRPHFTRADLNDDVNAGDAATYNGAFRFGAVGGLNVFWRYENGQVQMLKDAELDRMAGEAETLVDPDERLELVTQAYDLVNDSWAVLPLFNLNNSYGVNTRTVGEWTTFRGWPFFGRMIETIK